MPDLTSHDIPDQVQKLLDDGRWQDAVAALDVALAANPTQIFLWREKARTLIALGQPEEALTCYVHALAIAPNDAWLHAEQAAILDNLDRDDEAMSAYDRAIQLDPRELTILRSKAQLLTRLGRIPEALSVYDSMLAQSPQTPDFLIGKGDALMMDGKIEQAASYFHQAATIVPNSFSGTAWTSRADQLRTAGKFDYALTFYENAIQSDPTYAWAYRGKGLVLKSAESTVDEALRNFDRAIRLDPSNAALFCVEKGNILFDRKQFKLAAECYTKATDLDPRSQVAWSNLGLAQEALGDYSRGLAAAEAGLALNPSSVVALVHKGFCLDRLKRLEESTACYQKALELDPKDFWANNNMGWNLTQMKKLDQAKVYFDAAIVIDPAQDVPWLNKALNLRDTDSPHEAIDVLQRALQIVANKRDILSTLGYIHTEVLGEHDKALAYYQQRFQLDPEDVLNRANIADCLVKMGRFAEGRKLASQLLGKPTDNATLESNLNLIILASYALEGDSAGRARQFDLVLDRFYKAVSGGASRVETSWVFSGLLQAIRASNMSSESKFLLATAIDVQQGKLALSDMSFFSAAKPQSEATPAPAKTA